MAASDAKNATDNLPVVLITGCSSGIGRGCARLFARRGYRVYATMRRPGSAQDLRDEAAAAGWALVTPEMDVSDDESVRKVVSEVLVDAGRIDVVINNAGQYLYGPIEQTTPEEMAAHFNVNVLGMLRVCRAILPHMRERRAGTIINVGSLTAMASLPMVGPYQMTKVAVAALTETLRYEMIPFGVRVACIIPGPFVTDLHTKEAQTHESRDRAGPYAALIDAYRDNLRRQPRAKLESVLETIYRSARDPHPRLHYMVGPLSFLGGTLKKFVPDRLYEWIVRLRFRLSPPG